MRNVTDVTPGVVDFSGVLSFGPMGSGPPAVRISRLTKRYKGNTAVNDVSFDVSPGQTVGFLGPNGSGKTTVIRVLMGLLSPTSGTVEIHGRDANSRNASVRSAVGYLPGTLSLYEHMTAGQHLQFLADMRGIDCSAAIPDLAERLGLDLHRRIRDMSKGTKQKVGVVQAFMHHPSVLVMDEPTAGLDPIVQREFDAMLREANARGTAVLLSSHIMGEVERLASHVAIINAGRLLVFDDVDVLRNDLTHTVTLEFSGAVDPAALASVPGFSVLSTGERSITGSIRGSQRDLLRVALQLGLDTVHSPEPSLGDLFMSLVRREPRP